MRLSAYAPAGSRAAASVPSGNSAIAVSWLRRNVGSPSRGRASTRCWSGKDKEPDSDGKKDLENLFAQELKRRSMSSMDSGDAPSSGPAQEKKDPFASSATSTRPRPPPPPKAVTDGTADQRQRSLSMVNEGLEGLIPRASQLLQLGGSVFLAFLPFILAISLLFGGVYALFGDSFVHRGSPNSSLPTYVDPERLLSETTVDPYVPFDR